MSTIFTFEERIEKVHPKDRVGHISWTLPIRAKSRLAENYLSEGQDKWSGGLELLLKAGDENANPHALVNNVKRRDDLLKLVESPSRKRLGYNLRGMNLSRRSSHSHKTIEFASMSQR